MQPMENLDRQFDFDAARHVKKCSGIDERFVQRGELGRAEHRRLRHEMFSEQIFVLDHGAFERHQDHAALQERFGSGSRSEQLIVRENQPAGDCIEPGRAIENFVALDLRQSGRLRVTGKIERIDTRKTPGLVFAIRERKRFELCPSGTLLIAKPTGKFGARARRAGKNRRPGMFLRRFEFHYFIENSCLVSHARKIRRKRRSEDRRGLHLSWGRNPSRPSLPSQARSGA